MSSTQDIHSAIREAYASGEMSETVRVHLASCDACRVWSARVDRILDAAPNAYRPPDTAPTVAHIITTLQTGRRSSQPRRGSRWLVAAAVVIIAAGGAIVTRLRTDDDVPADSVLAVAAERYETGPDVRFVLETRAAVTIPITGTPIDHEPAAFSALPVCTPTGQPNQPTATTTGRRIDLDDAIESLANPDPCDGLEQLHATVEPAVSTALTELASTQARWQHILSQLDGESTPSPLIDTTKTVLRDIATTARKDARSDADRIVDEADATVDALAPFADAARQGDDTSVHIQRAETGLNALAAALVGTGTTKAPDDPTITWTQIATGTFDPGGQIQLSGTVEQTSPGATTAHLYRHFSRPDQDPLGLAPLFAGDSGTIPSILRLGPTNANPNGTTTYTVDASELDGNPLGSDTWTVTATTNDGTLTDLAFTTTDTGSTITSTVTFAYD